jgi:hypothetical protein
MKQSVFWSYVINVLFKISIGVKQFIITYIFLILPCDLAGNQWAYDKKMAEWLPPSAPSGLAWRVSQ